MGKPSAVSTALPPAEYIGGQGASRGTDTSQYPEERKSTETPRVVASERGSSPNPAGESVHALPAGGCRTRARIVHDPATVTKSGFSRSRVEPRTTEGNRPVGERALICRSSS